MQNDVFGLDDVAALACSIKGVQLDCDGVWTKEGCKQPCRPFVESDLRNILQAIKEIPKLFYKTSGRQKGMSSYTAKHILEEHRDAHSDNDTEYKYIPNGCFIIAMMHKGYVPKLLKRMKKNCYSPNVWLNARGLEGHHKPCGAS
jgi:hypothetical protein